MFSVKPLADPERTITDNDANGQSFFSTSVSPQIPLTKEIDGAFLRLAYLGGQPPSSLNDQIDVKQYQAALENPPELVPSGSRPIVWYVDAAPGSKSPWHRTVSVDVVVQLEGEIELTLEDGEKRVMKPGDVTVQRATMHKWENLTDQWSRMIAVMTECQPVEIGGKKLEMEFR